MKIAVASDEGRVAQHFGYCQGFQVYQVENAKVVSSETIANPGHRPGFLPNFLHDHGVKVIISGGMGGGAVEIFNEKGIEVVVGATGSADKVVEDYLQGILKSSGAICHEHSHDDK